MLFQTYSDCRIFYDDDDADDDHYDDSDYDDKDPQCYSKYTRIVGSADVGQNTHHHYHKVLYYHHHIIIISSSSSSCKYNCIHGMQRGDIMHNYIALSALRHNLNTKKAFSLCHHHKHQFVETTTLSSFHSYSTVL